MIFAAQDNLLVCLSVNTLENTGRYIVLSVYIAPVFEKIGGFREVTNGYPFWDNRDIFGGYTFIG